MPKNRTVLQGVADPDPYVFGAPGSGSGSISQRHGSGSFYHQAKIVRKILISTVLRLLYDFLSLKNNVNVPSKSNKQKKCNFYDNFLVPDRKAVSKSMVTEKNTLFASKSDI